MKNKKIFVYDPCDGEQHRIDIKRHPYSGWIIGVDDEFWCTCESYQEVDSEVVEIMKLYKWSFVRPI